MRWQDARFLISIKTAQAGHFRPESGSAHPLAGLGSKYEFGAHGARGRHRRGRAQLGDRGISAGESRLSRLTAEVLLAHILSWERARLIGHIYDPLAAGAWEKFRTLARHCAAGEPLHYLTGEREFYGLPFRVTPAVLIPRPETEILVEHAVEWVRRRGGGVRFVDVGTGSGCIAISVARELPGARGWATDISREALVLARENADRLGAAARIGFVCCDLLDCFPARPLFDLILSNPPYISGADVPELPRVVREHEPHQALFGGNRGSRLRAA